MTTDAQWAGAMPETYNRCLGPALFAPFAVYLGALAASLSPRRVLEIAAGTGIATAELVRALPEADITATDLNPAMVAWGAEHVPGATWAQADAQQLNLPDHAYDLVVCQFGAMFFPDKPAAFAEIARVLKPAGTLVILVWDVVATSPFSAAMVASLAAVLPEETPDFIVRVPHGYADPDQIHADLTAGGLRSVSIERVVLRGRADSARHLAEGYCLGSPLRFELEQRGSLDELTRVLGDEMIARLGDGPIEGDVVAYVATARTPASMDC